jgi:transcriptional regulator with XRE-family HTH domain
MENIGKKIKSIRELRNFSQEFVGNKIGISQSNYARVESNEVAITPERLQKIAEALNTTESVIKDFDENIIFNINKGDNSAAGPNCSVHNYQISPEIKGLYEDKIKLLEEKIKVLEEKFNNKVQYFRNQ